MYSTVNGFHKAVRADGRGRDRQASHPGGGTMQQIYHLFLHAMISSVISLGVHKVETSLHNFQKLG